MCVEPTPTATKLLHINKGQHHLANIVVWQLYNGGSGSGRAGSVSDAVKNSDPTKVILVSSSLSLRMFIVERKYLREKMWMLICSAGR